MYSKGVRIEKVESVNGVNVGSLHNGMYMCGVPSGGDSIYKKVNKNKNVTGLSIQVADGFTLILNVKYGTFRAVRHNVLVQPLIVDIKYKIADDSEREEMFE